MKDSAKPELVAFSEHIIGGVQSFYYNLLSNDLNSDFKKKWVLLKRKGKTSSPPPVPFDLNEQIVPYNPLTGRWRVAKKIEKFISNRKGIVLTNHPAELECLQLYPKPNKVIFHFVHDYLYLPFAQQFEEIIDVFCTHNFELYENLLELFPRRTNNIFFLPYGIKLSEVTRKENLHNKLRIAFVGRLCKEKGIYDLIEIDEFLAKSGLIVEWLIIGNGPESENFNRQIKDKKNFEHKIPATTAQIFDELKACDIFILPSIIDGTPVSLLESMSVGLVPILYKFNNGIKKIVTDSIGYVVDIGDMEKIGLIIKQLDVDRHLLNTKSANALQSARANFDVTDLAKNYYGLFKKFEDFKREKVDLKRPTPRLSENPLIPYPVISCCKQALIKMGLK